jgi:hypothetical protein
MPDEQKPESVDELIEHVNRRLVSLRNLALTAVATVAALGAVALAIIDQYNAARAHVLEQKTVAIDRHLENTDKAVVENGKRIDTIPDAPAVP